MSWLSIALQGAKAFAAANPELTQELVKDALDFGIQAHQKYEAQQAAKSPPKTEQVPQIAPEHHAFSDSQNLPGT